MSSTSDSPRPIQYYPIAPDVLEQFAFAACARLGPEFQDPDVARGLADCLTTVARVQANNLNRNGNSSSPARVE